MVDLRRRQLVGLGVLGPVAFSLGACASRADGDSAGVDGAGDGAAGATASRTDLFMPAEEERHEATWMCFPGRRDVWGRYLDDAQATIATIGLTVAEFEPVRMLVRPDDRAIAADLVGGDVELIDGPVDDLWARDTLPLFLVSDDGELAAARVEFNGWGDKQIHARRHDAGWRWSPMWWASTWSRPAWSAKAAEWRPMARAPCWPPAAVG